MIHHHLSPTNKNQDILPPYHKWCVWTLGPPTEFGAIRNAEFRLGSYSPSRFFHWRACIPKSQSHKKFHWKTKTLGFYEPTKERSVEHVEHFHCKKKSYICVISSSSCLCESLSLACGAISKGMVHPPNSTIHFLLSLGWSKKNLRSNVKSPFHPMYHKDLINVVVSNRLWVVAVQASLSQPLKMQGPLSPHRWCCSWCYPLAVKAHPVDLVKTWGWKPCCIWGWLL